jgi:predicted aspartyl protease
MLATILLAAAVGAPKATTVPFALVDNRMVIQATIDGKGPFAMIVDTGSADVTITPSVARRLGLVARAAGYAYGAGSKSTAIGATRIKRIQIGTLRFGTLDASVLDLSPIQRAMGFGRLDGIIGYSILGRLRVGVDVDAQTLTFSYAPLPSPKNAAIVAFTTDLGGIPQVPASVNGIRGTFMIDTGDRSSLTLFRAFAQANDFYRDAPVRNAITGIGVGGPIYSDVMRTKVALFGTTISGVVTRASRDRGGVFAQGRQAASVGMGLLKRFNLVYDYPEKEIVAWPSSFFSAPDPYRPLEFVNGSLHVVPPADDPTVYSGSAQRVTSSPSPGNSRSIAAREPTSKSSNSKPGATSQPTSA